MRGDGLEPDAAFIRDTLADRENVKPRQPREPFTFIPTAALSIWPIALTGLLITEGKRVFGGGEQHRRLCDRLVERRADADPARRPAQW